MSDDLVVGKIEFGAPLQDEELKEMWKAGDLVAQDIISLSDEVRKLTEALKWYQGEAQAAQRCMETSTTDAMLAIMTVLANDGGRRAEDAMT